MSRWWADPDSSELVLKSVDDSDVVNGVGTALLGYHGLAMGILKPLATRTLVDRQIVREALDGLDLTPIAKALGNATRPVMGDSSDRYGQLLAEEIHKRASEATERLLTVWTSTGMAWPHAVERASEVHGVPIERLGRYANVMKSTAVSPLVRADYADRALMDYASTVGNREAQTSSELISKQDKNFIEEEHPRNPDGKFKSKNNVAQSKLDKLNKLNALNRSQRIREVAPERNKETGNVFANVSPVVNIFDRSKKNVPQKASNKASNKASFRIDVKRDIDSLVRFGGSIDEPMGPGPFPAKIVPGDMYIALHKEDLAVIREGNGFFVAGRLGKPLIAFTREDLRDFAPYLAPSIQELSEEYVLLRTNYTPIMYTGDDIPSRGKLLVHKEIAQNARFRLDETDTTGTFEIGRTDFDLPMTNIQIDNDEDFNEQHVADHDVMSDYERWNFGKNLSGDELNDFNEEHPRANDGRFARKNEAQAKLDKLNKINQANRLRVVAAQERQADTQKLSDIKNVFAQSNNIFAAKEQVAASQKLSNKASNKLSNRIYPMLKTDKPLDFSKLYGVFVPNDSPDFDIDVDYHLQAVVRDHSNYPMAPMLSDDDTVPGLIGGLIDDFDGATDPEKLRQAPKSPKPIPFESTYQVRNVSERGVYASPTYAMEHALAQIQNGQAQEPIFDDWIYQLEVHPVGDGYEVVWMPYPEEPYQIIMGSEQDFEALSNGEASLEQLEDVSRLSELLAMRNNNDLSELSDAGQKNRASNPAVNAYLIKRGHNGGTR